MDELLLGTRRFEVYDAAPPVSEGELRAVEAKIGAALPLQIRDYYKRWNGGLPYPTDASTDRSVMVRIRWKDGAFAARAGIAAGFEGLLSVNAEPGTDLLRTWQDYRDRIPKDCVCFARDPGGSLFLAGVGEGNLGKIYYWSLPYEADLEAGEIPGYENIADVAGSFHEFLLALREEPRDDEPLDQWVRRMYAA